MKTCTRCGLTKPLDAFHVMRARPDGRRPACKACIKVSLDQAGQRALVDGNGADRLQRVLASWARPPGDAR